MKLGSKIILPIFLLLIVMIGAFSYLLMNLKQQEEVILTQGSRIRILNGLNERLGRQQEQTDYNVLAYRFNPDRSYLLSISQATLDNSKTLDEMYPYITTDKGRELVNNYIIAKSEVESLRAELIKAIDVGNVEQINLVFNKWNIKTENIKAALADISAFNINSLEKTLISIQDNEDKITQIVIILTLILFFAGIILFIYFKIIITAPIIELAKFSDQLANKNFNVTSDVKNTKRKDELGVLFRAFNTMVYNLKESYTGLETKVKERTEALSEAQQLAHIGSWEWDIVNNTTVWSDELYRLFEVSKDTKPTYEAYLERVHPEDQEFTRNTIREAGMAHRPFEFDHRIQLSNGSIRWIRGKGLVETDNSGKALKMTGTAQDITKEKEIDKQKSEFISIASHQLRTPLGSMRWNLELIESDIKNLPEEAQERFREVCKSNLRVINLVGELLNVTRIEAGRVQDDPTLTDIDTVIETAVKEMTPEADRRSVKLEFLNKKQEIQPILIDSKRFREVLQNLLSNAVRYTKEGGRIVTTLDKDEDFLIISVKDDGIGIPEKDLPRIFSKFFRSDNATKFDTEGSGLGLFVVKSYVEGFGGKVWFETKEGEGTTFYFTLPTKT
ncbi:MAG: ATP-binding protein [bacterium]|nr:ATP-binding protein [bacterium]